MTMPVLNLLLAAEGAEGPTSPFEVNLGLAFWTWLVFLVLLWVLYKFAWPAILSATVEREQRIAAQLAEAERLNAEAKSLLAEQQKQSAESRAAAQALLAEARSGAEKEKALILEKAQEEGGAMIERARREIVAEKDRALASLRREAVDISLAAASRLINQRLDAAGDRVLVEEYLKTLSREG